MFFKVIKKASKYKSVGVEHVACFIAALIGQLIIAQKNVL